MPLLGVLAEEVLLQLASLINGCDVIRLMVCGNRNLNAKLCKATILNCQTTSFRSFPWAVFSPTFPSLKSLSVTVDLHNYPISLLGRALIPPTPLEQLVSLTFCFAQSFSILDTNEQLSILLPNLETLVLRESSVSGKSRWLQNLPKRLTRLEMACGPRISSSPRENYISYRILTELPNTIESLILGGYCFVPSASNPPAMSMFGVNFPPVTWPPKLSTLHTSFWHSDILTQLPSTLTKARLTFRQGLSPSSSNSPSFGALPRGLISFATFGPCKLQATGELPPTLQSFNSSADFSHLPEIPHLPSSLTLFDPMPIIPETYFLNNLPNLSTLTLKPNYPLPEVLPGHLTKLVLDCVVPDASILPESLTRLEGVSFHSNNSFRHLPRKLTTLLLMTPATSSVSILHSSLITAQHCEELPPSLTCLRLQLCHMESAMALKSLPASLTDLTLDLHHYGTPLAPKRDFTHVGSYLHSSLRRLHFGLPTGTYASCPAPWYTWIGQYSSTNLGSLRVSPLNQNEAYLAANLRKPEYLASLPQSLVTLEVVVQEGWTENKTCLHRLPPTLRSLTLTGHKDRGSLVDRHLHHLPISLTAFSMSHPWETTPKLFDSILPRNILKISISGPTPPSIRLAIEKYYKADHWAGYAPAPNVGC